MSIDDPRKVRLLIEKMEASLPIPVRATPETLKIAETKGGSISFMQVSNYTYP